MNSNDAVLPSFSSSDLGSIRKLFSIPSHPQKMCEIIILNFSTYNELTTSNQKILNLKNLIFCHENEYDGFERFKNIFFDENQPLYRIFSYGFRP